MLILEIIAALGWPALLVSTLAIGWYHDKKMWQMYQEHSSNMAHLIRTLSVTRHANSAQEAAQAATYIEPVAEQAPDQTAPIQAHQVQGFTLAGGGEVDFLRVPEDATFGEDDEPALILENADGSRSSDAASS